MIKADFQRDIIFTKHDKMTNDVYNVSCMNPFCFVGTTRNV